MPLYEYECTSCHRRTEKIQKFSDPEITTCPFCGGPLARVLSAPAFALKGGGWYADGYGSAKPAAKEGASEAGSGGAAPATTPAAASAAGTEAAKPAAPAPAPAASTPAASSSPEKS